MHTGNGMVYILLDTTSNVVCRDCCFVDLLNFTTQQASFCFWADYLERKVYGAGRSQDGFTLQRRHAVPLVHLPRGWVVRPPREILAVSKDMQINHRRGAIRSSHLVPVAVHGVYGYPFMRSTVSKENMTLSGEECLHCLHLGRQPEYNWTPPPVVSKTFFVWPY